MTAVEIAQARAALPRPEKCRAIRQGAQLSIADVADELGTNPITVSRWERGERKPSKRFVAPYVELLTQLARIPS